jgi:hypothetical protein
VSKGIVKSLFSRTHLKKFDREITYFRVKKPKTQVPRVRKRSIEQQDPPEKGKRRKTHPFMGGFYGVSDKDQADDEGENSTPSSALMP